MPTINTADFFNKDAYSDLTIRFGNREFKAHRMILCHQSEYFKKLCGADAKFAESGQDVITLEDDDAPAVRSMLEWIYTFDYTPLTTSGDLIAMHHVEVCKLADKYMLPDLAKKASETLKLFLVNTQLAQLTKIWSKVHDGEYPTSTQDIVLDSCVSRVKDLLERCEAFRALLRERPGFSLDLLDRQHGCTKAASVSSVTADPSKQTAGGTGGGFPFPASVAAVTASLSTPRSSDTARSAGYRRNSDAFPPVPIPALFTTPYVRGSLLQRAGGGIGIGRGIGRGGRGRGRGTLHRKYGAKFAELASGEMECAHRTV